ncbi:unnamed protein product [Effrenium voratum]|nr:unnamed protein product [Effrenium voratum]
MCSVTSFASKHHTFVSHMSERPSKRACVSPLASVRELLAKGEAPAAAAVCRNVLDRAQEAAVAEVAEAWYLLGIVNDICHKHEDVAHCMRQAMKYGERLEIWPYLADYATRTADFDSAFFFLERVQSLDPLGPLGVQAASDCKLLSRTLRCSLVRRNCWPDVAEALAGKEQMAETTWRVQDSHWQWPGDIPDNIHQLQSEEPPTPCRRAIFDGLGHDTPALVLDKVFGPQLLQALQCCVEDFAVWRAKSPQRLLGFWLPAGHAPRCAPELAGRKLLQLLGEDLDMEWWCRTQAPRLGAHFHYDTHPFLDPKYGHLRPVYGTVLFLSDVGGPTTVLNQTATVEGHSPPVPACGCAVACRANRWLVFPGELRHGAVGLDSPSEFGQRAVILYNFWRKDVPRTPRCVPPDFSHYRPACAWAPTAKHMLCQQCLESFQEEPLGATRVSPRNLSQPELDHTVPIEGTPNLLPMPGAEALRSLEQSGFVMMNWQAAAQEYLEKAQDCNHCAVVLSCTLRCNLTFKHLFHQSH